MTDKVLTDEEKDALLDGLSSGEVEVQSTDGPLYAEVKEFVIGPRSRIATNSYPRLQIINKQLAGMMSKQAELLLNLETEITARPVGSCLFGELCERIQGLSLAIEFSAAPLKGPGMLYLESAIIGHLVEAFFGGSGDDVVEQSADLFSPGETVVTHLFADVLLQAIQDTWHPVIEFSLQRMATRYGNDVIDDIELSDEVLYTEFEMAFAEHREIFHVAWPMATISPLVPIFEGQKRDRDAAEDRRWEQALRGRAAGLTVGLSSCIGQAQLSLAEVAELQPGDIINIDSPRMATVFAQQIPVLEGRYGVHDGRNAIEATRWLEPDCDVAQKAGNAST